MLILGGQCGGFGTDIGYVNIVGPGKGRGVEDRHWEC